MRNGSVVSALERYIRTSAVLVAPQVMEELALLISALVQVSHHDNVNYAVDGRTKSEVAMFTLA